MRVPAAHVVGSEWLQKHSRSWRDTWSSKFFVVFSTGTALYFDSDSLAHLSGYIRLTAASTTVTIDPNLDITGNYNSDNQQPEPPPPKPPPKPPPFFSHLYHL